MTLLQPYALSVEHLVAPLGVDEPRPRFSWRLSSPRNGVAQGAYRIEARRLDAPWNGATGGARAGEVVWDSGRVEAPHALCVAYEGAPLEPLTDYEVTVEVWPAAAAAEPGTVVTTFATGRFGAPWEAVWIGRDLREKPAFLAPAHDDLTWSSRSCSTPSLLRTSFRAADVVRARLHITARGIYEARVNGSLVREAQLDPGWTSYDERVLSRTFDVTDSIVNGENVVAVVLADGWYAGFVGYDARQAGKLYGSLPMLLAEVHLETADGQLRVVATSQQWRESAGEYLYADLLMGEGIDPRKGHAGWDRPGFDDSAWRHARVLDEDTSSVRAAAVPPIRTFAEVTPVSFSRDSDGVLLADFGQNLVGHVRLTLRHAVAGRLVELLHGEALTEDGDLYTENLRRAEARDLYYPTGAAEETFEPTLTVHGFRYVRLAGVDEAPHRGDVVAVAVSSDLEQVGTFTCNNPDVNQIVRNTWWSQRGNFLSVPTDCPQRDERLGWLADAQVFAPTAARFANVDAFFASWIEEILLSQSDEGVFTDVAPAGPWRKDAAPAWGDAATIIPMLLWDTYGDRRVIERTYPSMVAWVEHVHRNNPDLIWTRRTGSNYGDWLHTGPETPRSLVATAYFALSSRLTSRAAGVLGDAEAERYHAELADRIADAFRERFVLPDGRLESDTQTAYLLALDHDLLLPEDVLPAVERLVDLIREAGDRLTTGFLGVSKLCRTLSRFGRDEVALTLLAQDAYPSWLFPIRHGATTIWERWDGWTPERGFQAAPMNSLNHYSLGAVVDWIFATVGGLDVLPGGTEVVVRPRPGAGVTSARTSLETPCGLVCVRWELRDDVFEVTLQTPPGMRARFVPPPFTGAPDRELGSGHHRISVPLVR